jgi:hypothetical protein
MTYVKVKWHHANQDYPVLLFSELDDARMEARKVEVFADGRRGWASVEGESGGTGLGVVPMPELSLVDAEPEFESTVIDVLEFESEWKRARAAVP